MRTRSSYTISWGDHRLCLGQRTCVMGILNVTPDSFSDGGRYFAAEDAVVQGERLVADGADILDIGGESTRPFSDAVAVEEEIRRVIPVIERLAPRLPVPISIDTTKAAVAQRAIEAGASIINDIGSLRLDPAMADVAATHGVPIILMHMLGTPKTMQVSPEYTDLIKEIRVFFEHAIDAAERRGISRSRLILDPGIGFGKTVMQNLLLIQRLHEFTSLGLPLLIGASRKSFLRRVLKDSSGKDRSIDDPEVETGSQAAICAAILNGAHVVRVHDVASSRETVKITDAIINAE